MGSGLSFCYFFKRSRDYNCGNRDRTYDANGNLLTSTNSCGKMIYTWDVRNRLAGISGYKSDCTALTASFNYDAIGRRISKTINGTTTQYLYDGVNIIQEIQGTAKTNYIRTLSIDEPLTRIKADGTVRHYVMDALGSIIALTDDIGAVKTTYTYDPFGNVTISGEASDNPFQYTGRENDGTGLYYYRARYYSPELQRFLSEDPIRFREGSKLLMVPKMFNLYVYVLNNPLKYIDVTGKKPSKNKYGELCLAKITPKFRGGCPDWTDCLVCCGELMEGLPEEAILVCISVCEEGLDLYEKTHPECKCKGGQRVK